ncbi:MAG: hypothetical protein LIO67_03680 [Lachnospiraceae bacterium]|nr:hypothetical protein [Lachnospiraceae bacterium]
MKALTRFRRFLSIMLTLAIVFNSVDLSTINASATEVKEAEELQEDAGEASDEDFTEEDENTGEENETEADGEQSSQDADSSATDEAAANESADAADSSGEESETEEDGDAEAEEAAEADVLETESIDNLSVLYGSVTVSAELSGGIPEDVDLVVESADKTAVLSAIDLEGATTTLYFAMSAHLEEDGEEYELQDGESVTLTLEGVELDEDALGDMWFLHISDGEVVDDASFANTEYDSDFSYTDNGDGTYDVSYTTSSFSDFAIASQTYMLMTLEEEETSYVINLQGSSLATVDGIYEVPTSSKGTLEITGSNQTITIINELDSGQASKTINAILISGSNNKITFGNSNSGFSFSTSNASLTISGSGNTLYTSGDVSLSSTGSYAAISVTGSGNNFSVSNKLSLSSSRGNGFAISGSGNAFTFSGVGTVEINSAVSIGTGATLNLAGSANVVFNNAQVSGAGTMAISGATVTGTPYFASGVGLSYTSGVFFAYSSNVGDFNQVNFSSSSAGFFVGQLEDDATGDTTFEFGTSEAGKNDEYVLEAGYNTFAVILSPQSNFSLYGTIASRAIYSYTSSSNTEETGGTTYSISSNAIKTYYGLKRVAEPEFSRAYFENLENNSGSYSADLVTAVRLDSEEESLETVGFKLLGIYEITDDYYSNNSISIKLSNSGAISSPANKSKLTSDEISAAGLGEVPTSLTATMGDTFDEENVTYTIYTASLTGLKAGYIYVYVPYATTSAGIDVYVANDEDGYATSYYGETRYKTLTTGENASFAISIVSRVWPSSIEMTYGDTLSDIAVSSGSSLLDANGYISYYDADSEAMTTAVSILRDSSLVGTFRFEIYDLDYETVTVAAGDYLDAGDYYVKMTFAPDTNDSYSKSFADETSDYIPLKVNPMPVTVKTNGNTLTDDNKNTSYVKVYDGTDSITLKESDITLVGLRGNSTDGYTEDSVLTTLAESEKVADKTVEATASGSDANTWYDRSALISSTGSSYTLTLTEAEVESSGIITGNYTFVESNSTSAYTSDGVSTSSTLYGWIAQRKVTTTVQINEKTSSSTYVIADGMVETGQYFYITVGAETVSGSEDSTGLITADDTVSEFSSLKFKLTSSAGNGVDELAYGSGNTTRLLYEEDSVAIATTNTLKEIFTGNYYPVDADGKVLEKITGSVKVNQVEPEQVTYYTVDGEQSGIYYTSEVNYAATGGYTSVAVGTSDTKVSDDSKFPTSGTTATVTESGEYYLQLLNNDTGAFTSVLPLGNLIVDTGTPEVTNISLSPLNESSAAKTINKLTFGIFFNEAIKVTVTGFAGDSGLYSLVYDLGDGNGPITITGWVSSGNDDGKGTITFNVDLDAITGSNTGEVYFYITNNAGATSIQYTISTDTTIENGVATIEASGKTIVVAESDAPTVVYDVSGENGTQLNTAGTSGWFTKDATLTATIADNEENNGSEKSSIESGIAYYEVTITAYDKNDTEVASASTPEATISTIQDSSSADAGKKFEDVQTYLDKYTATASETKDVYYFMYTITAYDHAGNDSGEQTRKVYVDSTAPTLTGKVEATDASENVVTTDIEDNNTSTEGTTTEYYTIDTYTSQTIIVSLSSYDATSGVSSIKVEKDGTVITGPTTKTNSDGTVEYDDYEITSCGVYVFTVTDDASNSTSKTIAVTAYDKQEPTIGVSYGTYTPGEWTADEVSVNVKFTDTASVDGVSVASGFSYLTYSYKLNDESGTTESGNLTTDNGLKYDETTGYTFTLSKSGVYKELTVTVYDRAGNSATYKIADDTDCSGKTINIDAETPTLSVAVAKGDGTSYTSGMTWAKNGETVVYTLTAGDSVSDLTYMVSANGTDYVDMEVATASGGILYDVAAWDGSAYTLTFSKSYEGMIYFKVKNASGTYSVISTDNPDETCVQKVQISVETFSEDIINSYITLDNESYSNSWYDAESVTISVSPVASQENKDSATNPTPGNTVTTEVTLTKYSTSDTTSGGTVVTEGTSTLYNYCDYGTDGNNGESSAYTQTLDESGYYVLKVVATDEAGNTAEWEDTIKLDVKAPEAGTVTYTEVGAAETALDGLRSLIRKLSFGLFFNEAVEVTVTFTDDLSGIGTNKIYYEKIGIDGSFTGDGEALTVSKTTNGTTVYSATISLTLNDTSGYIRYWAIDEAGNESSHYNLGYDLTTDTMDETTGQILWKLENQAPEITALTASDGNKKNGPTSDTTDTPVGTSEAATWLTGSGGATVSATIEDSGSGLYSVTASYLYVDSFDKISQLEAPESNGLSSETLSGTCYTGTDYQTKAVIGDDAETAVTTAYWKADSAFTKSGVYKVTIYAEDNATNVSEKYTLYVYVDVTAPVVTVSYNDESQAWVNAAATNQYITVDFTVAETTSGTASVTVKGMGKNALKDGDTSTDEITLTVNESGSYSFTAYANDTFTITVTDTAGNENVTTADTTNPVTVSKIDLVDPVYTSLTVNSDKFSGDFDVSTNYYTSDYITFTITASDSISGLASYQMYYNTTDSNENGTKLDGASGSWTQTTAGKDDASVTTENVKQSGTYYVYVVLTDVAGNTFTSETTQIRLENGTPSAYLYSYKYNSNTYSTENPYNSGDWINDDGVIAILKSGLQDNQASYYYAVNSGATSGSEVSDSDWIEITFADGKCVCQYGTFTLTEDDSGAEVVEFVTTRDGSNNYYFKVVNNDDKTRVGYNSLTVNLDHYAPSNATLTPNVSAKDNWYSTLLTFTLTDVVDAYDATLAEAGIASSTHIIKYLLTQTVYTEYDAAGSADAAEIKALTGDGTGSLTVSDGNTELTTSAPTTDGIWYLYYWVEDGATNSSAIACEKIQVDTTKPTIAGNYTVTYSDGNTVLNILTFGVFGNKGYTVTVDLSDDLSGVESLAYAVSTNSGLDGTADITYYADAAHTQTSSTMTCYAMATFTISGEFTDGIITMTAYDYAGNSKDATLTATGDVTKWTFTTADPTVELEWTDTVNDLGWMKSGTTAKVSVTATEEKAGLKEVYYALSGATTLAASDDTYLLTSDTTSKAGDKTTTYTESGNLTLNDLSQGVTTLTVTAISNAGEEGSKDVSIKVDTEAPVYNTDYTTNQTWTNEDEKITFTLTDATSGVRCDTIKVYSVSTADGTEITNEVTTSIAAQGDDKKDTDKTSAEVAANTKYEVSFTVTGNGYYYIVAEDMAGNQKTAWITVDNVDQTTPATPEISVSGETNSAGWYSAYETVTFTAAANSGFAYATETLCWQVLDANGTKVEEGFSTEIVDGKITCTYTFTEDGEYTLLAYMKDAAGNYSSNVTVEPFEVSGTQAVKVDTTAPDFTGSSIVVKDYTGESTIADAIANFFGFGNYISTEDGIQISITTTDSLSGVNTTSGYYKLSTDTTSTMEDGKGNVYTGTAVITKNDNDDDSWTYTITLASDALKDESTITVWVYDVAGNKAADYKLVMYKNGEKGSENWQIDTLEPEISVSVSGMFGDTGNVSGKTYTSQTTGTTVTDTDYYYYSSYPTLSVTADDGEDSGLYLVKAYVEYTKPGETDVTSTEYLFGSLAAGAKDYSSEEAKTKTKTDDTYEISADGTYTIHAEVADNANNKADITVTILVDIEKATGAFTVLEDGSTVSANLADVDFTSTSSWKTKSQTISFTLTDDFSKVDASSITLTATGVSNGTPALTKDSADALTVSGSFTITENGTYTLSWSDMAGNTSSQEIVVKNLDTTAPAAPGVTVTPANTAGDADTGETNSNVTVTGHADLKWYTAESGEITTTITANLDDENSNASTASTYYTLSYGAYGDDITEGTKTLYASTDQSAVLADAPTITSTAEDGVYVLRVWNEDDAAWTTEADYTGGSTTAGSNDEVTYYMYVDRNAPKVITNDSGTGTRTSEPTSGTTGNDVYLYYVLNDGSGSGIDTDTIKLYYSATDADKGAEIATGVSIGTVDTDGNLTISYMISKAADNTNGYYTLSFADEAGNASSTVLHVTKMDNTQLSSETVAYSSSTSATTGLPTLSSDEANKTIIDSSKYANVYLYLTGTKAGTAVFTYSGTLTSPTNKTYTYSHVASSEAMALWISDSGDAVDLRQEEGLWTLATKTETNQEGVAASTATYYILIDKTAPAITNSAGTALSTDVYPDGYSTTPTNEDVALSFKVSDASASIETSGIKSVTVSTDDGSITLTDGGEASVSPVALTEADGIYTFYAKQNGEYTITVTDNANNVATYTFTVSNIDKEAPVAFAGTDITVDGVDGSSVSDETVYKKQWYKQNTSSENTQTWVEVSVPASDTGSELYTYVAFWPYDESGTNNTHAAYDTVENTGDSYYVTKLTSEADAATKMVALPEDGKWNVAVWRQDEAGNITKSDYITLSGTAGSETMSTSLVVYTDITMPDVDVASGKISIAQTGTSTLAQIANFLTFGNFFNKGFEITLSGISDDTSKVKTVYYALTDTSATAATVLDKTASITKSGEATLSGTSYVITLDTSAKLDGYIWIYVEDYAGNVTTPVALKAYESGSADGGTQTWMIDTVAPTITFSYSSVSGTTDDGTADTGWYNIATGYPTVKATAEDGVGSSTTSGVSGIAKILRTILQKATESTQDYTEKVVDANVFPGDNGSVSAISAKEENSFAVTDSAYGDGVYELIYTVTDNALQEVEYTTKEIKVDLTRPTLKLTAGTGDAQKTSSAGSESAETTEGTLNGYFELTKGTDGVGTNWLNSDQLVALTLADATSGFSSVEITTTGGGLLKNSSKEDVTSTGITSDNAGESFYVCANGTYTITVTDAAGNKTIYVLTVTNVDTTKPTTAPVVTVTAAAGSTAATGTSWLAEGTVYNIDTSGTGTGGATVSITAPAAATGEAPQTTYYVLWNTSDTDATQATQKADVQSFTEMTTFTITDDGVWELSVYTMDEAGNITYASGSTESAGQKIYVDIDRAASDLSVSCTSGEPAVNSGEYTSEAITLQFDINDGSTGSGIDQSTVQLTYSATENGEQTPLTTTYNVQSGIADGDKTATITVAIQPRATYTNGYYTLTYSDLAGNEQSVTKYVWWMDDTLPADIPVATADLEYSSIYSDGETDAKNYYTDTTDDTKTLTLTFTPATYSGTSVLTTTVTITSPGDKEYVYTLGSDGKLTPAAGGDAISSFTAFDEEGEWSVSISAKNQSGTENTREYTYYIDTTAPTHSDESGNTDIWVSSEGKTISFKVTDAVSGVDYTSGVKSVVVTPTDGGSLTGNVTSLELTPDSDGLCSFTALSNGTYTVTLTDNVGNEDSSYVITVTHIDTTAPANATVTIADKTGNAISESLESDYDQHGWYIDSTGNQVTITVPEQVSNYDADTGEYAAAAIKDEAKIITYISLWKESSTDPSAAADATADTWTSGAISTEGYYCAALATGSTITLNLPEGVWNLKVWTVDEAGNHCQENGTDSYSTATLYVDTTVPVIDNSTLTITEADSVWDTIVNFLQFGNFFYNEIGITVDVTDATSTPAQLYYAVSSDGTTAPEIGKGYYTKAEMSVDNSTDTTVKATFTFDLSEANNLGEGYIWVFAVDDAGNVSTPYPLKAYSDNKEGSAYWMIDIANPTVIASLVDSSDTSRVEEEWFNSADKEASCYPVIMANFTEGYSGNVSGIYSITREVLDSGENPVTVEGVAYGKKIIYDDHTVQTGTTSDYIESDAYRMSDVYEKLADGEYIVRYTIVDNAGNTVERDVYVNIDTTAPELGGDLSGVPDKTASATNQNITISGTAVDDTSGVAYVTVKAADGGKLADTEGNEVDTVTIQVETDGTFQFEALYNGTYTITITDNAGNESEGTPVEISNINKVAPEITETSPANGDTDVDYKDSVITITVLDDSKGTITYDAENPITIEVNGEPYTIDPTKYPDAITISSNGLAKDEDGYQLYLTDDQGKQILDASGDPIPLYETTITIDLSKIDGLTYAQDVEVPVYNPVTGEPVYEEDGDGNLIQATDEDGNPLYDDDNNPIYVQKTETETLNCLDADTVYTVTIPEGAFTDEAGNPTAAETITFTTAEASEDDPWLEAKTLEDVEIAGVVDEEDGSTSYDTTNITTSPEFDADTGSYTLFVAPGALDPTLTKLAEDLAVIISYDEFVGSEVTVSIKDANMTEIASVDYAAVTANESAYVQEIPKTDEDGNPVYKTDVNGDPIQATDGEGNLLYEDEEETIPIYEQETEKVVVVTFTADQVNKATANGFGILEVVTNNHGSKSTYTYVVSVNGISENLTNQASTTGDHGNVEITVPSGAIVSALNDRISELIGTAQTGFTKLAVQMITTVPRESAITEAVGRIESVWSDYPQWNKRQLYYFDFTLNIISNGVVEEVSETDELEDADPNAFIANRYKTIPITITLPSELKGYSEYAVFYDHEGVADYFGATDDSENGIVVLSADGTQLTIYASQFSIYAVTGKTITSSSDTSSSSGSGSGSSTETVYVTNTVTQTSVTYVPVRSVKGGSGSGGTVETTSQTEDTGTEAKAGEETGDEDIGGEETEEAAAATVCPGIKDGLALINLLMAVFSLMTAEYSTLKQKKKKKIPNDILCIASLLLFFITQPLEGLITRVDEWTPWFVVIFAVQLVITVLKFKSDEEEPEAETAGAEKN